MIETAMACALGLHVRHSLRADAQLDECILLLPHLLVCKVHLEAGEVLPLLAPLGAADELSFPCRQARMHIRLLCGLPPSLGHANATVYLAEDHVQAVLANQVQSQAIAAVLAASHAQAPSPYLA